MIDMPRAGEGEITSAVASVMRSSDPVESAYGVLEEVVARHELRDAWLVLHPAGLSAQVFRHGRRPTNGADVRRLAARPTGLYGEPAIDPAVGALLGACCEAAFAARATATHALLDVQTGLLSRRAIDLSLARAAASASRHRWSTTAVLVTTAGSDEGDRWPDLAAALGEALRAGDVAGVAARGTALALLGNAGADAVRPFLARLRAALSASGWDSADLLAATAATPQESVDPSELWRLATQRLVELGADPLEEVPAPTLELELRLLPAVVCVGVQQNGGGPEMTVVRLGPDASRADIEATVRRRDAGLAVHVVTAAGPSVPAIPFPGPQQDGASLQQNGGGAVHVNGAHSNGSHGSHGSHQSIEPEPPPPVGHGARAAAHPAGAPTMTRTTTALGDADDAAHSRVTLVDSTFDASRGLSEVTLALGATRGTGRAPAGALVGGAQAALVALGALGRTVPFYLVSAERARTIPGEPVVVVLAPRDDVAAAPTGERIGVASGATDVEAAGRAVLAALNRFLAGPVIGA